MINVFRHCRKHQPEFPRHSSVSIRAPLKSAKLKGAVASDRLTNEPGVARGGKWGVWTDSLKLWLQQSHRFGESCVTAPVEHDPRKQTQPRHRPVSLMRVCVCVCLLQGGVSGQWWTKCCAGKCLCSWNQETTNNYFSPSADNAERWEKGRMGSVPGGEGFMDKPLRAEKKKDIWNEKTVLCLVTV